MKRHHHLTVTRYLGHLGSEHGLTLLELCVVLIILGILTAIAVPLFLDSRKKADRNTAEYNLKIAGGCMNRIWFDIVDSDASAGKIEAYRDYDPPDPLKSTGIYAAEGYVPVDARYLSIPETRITWVNMAMDSGSAPIASADLMPLAAASYSFSIVDIWRAGQSVGPGEEGEYARDWSLLPGKVMVMDDMYYWEDGWKDNADNSYITLMTLERSGVAHFLTMHLGGIADSGKFPWWDGAGDPGDSFEGDTPPEQPTPGGEEPDPGTTPDDPGNPPADDPGDPPGTTPEPPADDPGDPPGTTPEPPADDPGDPPGPGPDFSLRDTKFTPQSINLESNGVFNVTFYLPDGYSIADIDLPATHCGGATAIEVKDAGGGKFMFTFDRQDLTGLPVGNDVTATITGRLHDGTCFSGSDQIKVIDNK